MQNQEKQEPNVDMLTIVFSHNHIVPIIIGFSSKKELEETYKKIKKARLETPHQFEEIEQKNNVKYLFQYKDIALIRVKYKSLIEQPYSQSSPIPLKKG